MPRNLTSTERSGDNSIQIEVILPVRIRRRETQTNDVSTSTSSQGLPGSGLLTRIPRIARLMALAIKFQDIVDRGEVRDYADLARLGYVTRARLTQIMNLSLLAPDIQEQLLDLGNLPEMARFAERRIRSLAKSVFWIDQRRALREISAEQSHRHGRTLHC